MPESMKLEKAFLVELEEGLKTEKRGGRKVEVQFNPETMKLSFSNQVDTGDQKSGSAGMQFVKAGTTKLTLQLWFDVTALPGESKKIDDVRKLTQEVVLFMTAQPSKADNKKLIPPGVSFRWGSFRFDGIMESLEESIEFFSNEGKPLRSSLSLSLSQQKILVAEFEDKRQPGGGAVPGTRPLAQIQAGATLQGMADQLGKGGDWQEIAAANNIENPRFLGPGQFVDLNVNISGKR